MRPRSAILEERKCQIGCGGADAGGHTGGFGKVPCGATQRCTEWVKMPTLVWGTHVGGAIWGFGGAHYWATKRCTGWANMPN
eukprot:8713285-Pyramimonas_sp.AAC.1